MTDSELGIQLVDALEQKIEMTELGNELRFDNKPACDDGAFRAPDGRSVRYRMAAVPTKAHGDEHCGLIAVGDCSSETI